MSSTRNAVEASTYRQCIDTIRDTGEPVDDRAAAIISLVGYAEAGLSMAQMHQIADTLQIALLDEHTKIAERAIWALVIIEPPGTVDILQTEVQENDNVYIRLCAVIELWRWFSDRVDCALIARVAQTDDDEDVRWAAEQALKRCPKERSRRGKPVARNRD